MGKMSRWGGAAVVCLASAAIGCGGSTPAPDVPATPNGSGGPSAPSTSSTPSAPSTSSTPSAPSNPSTDAVPTVPPVPSSANAANDAKYDDPGEHPDGHEMMPLFT